MSWTRAFERPRALLNDAGRPSVWLGAAVRMTRGERPKDPKESQLYPMGTRLTNGRLR